MWQEKWHEDDSKTSPDPPQVARICGRVSRFEIRSDGMTLVSHRQLSLSAPVEQDKSHVPESTLWDENFSLGWRLDQSYVPIWSKRFSYENIEEERKMLFAKVSELEKRPDKKSVLDFCRSLNAHFMHEEMMLKLVGFPESPQRKIQNKIFLENMQKNSGYLNEELIAYAKEWLVNHIKTTDFLYKGRLNPPLFWKLGLGPMH